MRRSAAFGLLLLAAAVAACSNPGDAGDTAGVLAVDDQFLPDVLEVDPGTTVEWKVEGDNPHNVVAADGSWQSPQVMERGDRFTRAFEVPGVYPYYCTFHGTPEGEGMAGYLVVGDVPAYERPERRPLPTVAAWTGVTRRVPGDYPTIQDAVDAADPGDLVLIAPGIYREAVVVRTPSLVIRGEDRNTTILDGGFELTNGIQVVADGVAIENLTARNYVINGFYWTGVEGYRGSYLTAHNNGDYGIYAFDSEVGRIEHSYASGNRDSGFYIGQCTSCRAVVENVVSENNGLAYSGTNAGGDLYLISSLWRNNMGGIVPNSLDSELYPPQRGTTIVGNLIIDNNNEYAPTKGLAGLALGEGIVLGGGQDNLVERNLVVNHDRYGIVVAPLPDQNLWWGVGNTVRDNVVVGTGLGDLALIGPWAPGNVFVDNRHAGWSTPPLLELYHGTLLNLPVVWDLRGFALLLGAGADQTFGYPPGSDYRTFPPPGPQPNMPDPLGSPPVPAVDVFERPDLDALEVPSLPAGTAIRGKEVTVSGIPVSDPTVWTVLFSLYAYFLPLALMGTWLALAVWDLARRHEELGRRRTLVWLAAIFLLPFLGVIAYLTVGGSKIPGWLRAAVVWGGIAAYLVVFVVLVAISGAV
ncbi:MAG TPA: plastocyanin [Actinobacteria bacterium]|nr:plastocyanin [Actinomycetota bacterium]